MLFRSILPAAYVNSAPIHGSLEFATIFKAICAGFVKGSEPGVCHKCAMCTDAYLCVELGKYNSAPGSLNPVSAGQFVLSIFLVCAIFIALIVWHKKKTKEAMRDQVRGILAEYMPLEGDDGEIGSPMDLAQRGVSTSLITHEVLG